MKAWKNTEVHRGNAHIKNINNIPTDIQINMSWTFTEYKKIIIGSVMCCKGSNKINK